MMKLKQIVIAGFLLVPAFSGAAGFEEPGSPFGRDPLSTYEGMRQYERDFRAYKEAERLEQEMNATRFRQDRESPRPEPGGSWPCDR
jgi:hypothetical protein